MSTSQAGRKPSKHEATITFYDMFARRVRKVLRGYPAPLFDDDPPHFWGDAEALLILRLSTEDKFLHPEFANRQAIHMRCHWISSIRSQYQGDFWELIAAVANTTKYISPAASMLAGTYLLSRDNVSRLEALESQSKLNPVDKLTLKRHRSLIDDFWNLKAGAVVDKFRKLTTEGLTERHVENCRSELRAIQPFRLDPEANWDWLLSRV